MIYKGREVGKRKTRKAFKREEMKKNIYNIIEIDIIFKNCQNHQEVFEACRIFKQLHSDHKLSDKNYQAASQYSCIRFKELTQM